MTCKSCKQQISSSQGVIDFKRLTLLDAKHDRTRPSGYQALERLYSCCNCGKRWHVSLSRKWPTDPLPEHEWWVEPPSSTTPLRGAGLELKHELARVAIAATHAVREVDPRARFVHTDPLISVVPASEEHRDKAEAYARAQHQMKLIVDTMSVGAREAVRIWQLLGLFIGLIALESVLWRIAGWLGCKTVVATGVDVRLDLFKHFAGHPISYFSNHVAGAFGNRITATAGATGALFGALVRNGRAQPISRGEQVEAACR